jgi:hypothetical protein
LLATKEAPAEPKELRARRGERPSPRPLVSASAPSASQDKGSRPNGSAESQAKPSAGQHETRRTIERSNGDEASTSTNVTLNRRDGKLEDEPSNGRKPVAGYVDKWTGERVVPSASPARDHPWRTTSPKLRAQLAKDQLAREQLAKQE